MLEGPIFIKLVRELWLFIELTSKEITFFGMGTKITMRQEHIAHAIKFSEENNVTSGKNEHSSSNKTVVEHCSYIPRLKAYNHSPRSFNKLHINGRNPFEDIDSYMRFIGSVTT